MPDSAGLGMVLITGGTGSFGHAFVEYALKQGVQELRILSRDEYKQDLMRQELHDSRAKFYLGDVRDRASVDRAMEGVDHVFHAAALKEVPSCEFFPMQAVMTNVLGSSNVIESAIAHDVKSIVCLSTDKAVQPVNAMGMTKALMEKAAAAAARDGGHSRKTVITVTRYGNVMCSRGSVIPLFIEKIKRGEPLTVTEPTMTRFLMSMGEAIELVLFAMENARPGDLFIRKAPASTIGDLAIALKQLFHSDVPVQVIGSRHGEKLHETLATADELSRSEDIGDYWRVRLDDRGLNYDKYFTEGNRDKIRYSDYTSANARRLSVDEVISVLAALPQLKLEGPSSAGQREDPVRAT
jgi:UDP-N-acetylglucosamine 4,6-dehydratase